MPSFYTTETEITGSCGTKRIGLPTFSLEKARGNARTASMNPSRRIYVFGQAGCTCAVFEDGNELPPGRW